MTLVLEKGCVARVLRGRGTGSTVLILGEDPEGNMLVANGRRMRVETPKRKNRKHLKLLVKREAEDAPSNRRVRQILAEAEKGIIEQEGLFCQRMT